MNVNGIGTAGYQVAEYGMKKAFGYVAPNAPEEVRKASQNTERKVFQRDTLELSQLSEDRKAVMNRMKHTVLQSVTLFSDTRAGILKEIRMEKGGYDESDVVNACRLTYAKLYSEIEKRYENNNEQYYKIDGTPLTKADEIAWLDREFENEVKWQRACAKIAANREVFQGHVSKMPTEDIPLVNTNETDWEHYMVMKELSGKTLKDGNYDVEDVMKPIMEAYGTMYNDIVEEHKDGDRQISYDLTGRRVLSLEEAKE